MNNNHPIGVAAKLMQCVDWNNVGNTQEIIEACNAGSVGPALTNWLRNKSWESSEWVSREIGEIKKCSKIPTNYKFNLRQTGPTFGDWLVAREKLHHFLTGEMVDLHSIFTIPLNIFTRTDIMPIFRPAGATNRMALDWKVKLGMKSPYEEADVMEYTGADGSQVPELYYINRSIAPDADTLGDNAMSPDQLMAVQDTIWTNLYGWSDADSLYFLITGTHLDSGETLTWFPNDRLPGDRKVASGDWNVSDAQAKFYWRCCDDHNPFIGARVARAFELRKK